MTGTDTGSRLDAVRQVADAVLYEGYLLYPYRATSSKNRMRWQFGVLGPPDVQRTGGGEEPAMHVQCLLRADDATTVGVSLRFLQLQIRDVQRGGADGMASVERLTVDGRDVYRWDEAVEREIPFGPYRVSDLTGAAVVEPVDVPGGEDVEPVGADARIVRRRRALAAQVAVRAVAVESGVVRVEIAVANTAPDSVQDRDAATQLSFLGAHLLLSVTGGEWISSLDPPPQLASAVATCTNSRCWPVLAGPEGSTDVVLGSPIILYDHPAVAEQSAGALFDSTEIDEILTLRVMTMTPQEKAEARATDPHAATIIDRCDAMSANSLQLLHGVLRDPHAASELPAPGGWKSAADDGATWSDGQDDVRTGWDVQDDVRTGSDVQDDVRTWSDVPAWTDTGGRPWWDPAVDSAVDPARDVTVVAGVRVSKGSKVRLRPNRRADAQDLFFADQAATVTGVFADVDGETHVAVVLDDDPAAELHDWYGRYLYFAPDEVEPLTGGAMDTGPAQYRDEEPQSARGAPGSRDTGSDEPGGGPVDRPSGTSDAGEGTTIDPQEPIDDASPTLASGDQGG